MASILFFVSLIIILCIILNKVSSKVGMPMLLAFIVLGMLFGSDGVFKIPFDNYKIAESICSIALIFIIFYGGFGTNLGAAKPVAVHSVLLSTLGVVLTALTLEISKKQIEAKRIDTEEKIALQLEKTKKDYETSLKQLDIAKQREVIAKNNNEVASKQYRAGLISVTDRLSAENDIYKESLNKIETTIKQRQAAIDVYQASGSLLQYIKSN